MGGYIDFKISVLGDVQFERNLVQFSESISDWTETFKKAGDIFYRVEKEQFDSQGRYSGGWVALSPKYAAWKAKHWPGRSILERTGVLRTSLLHKSSPYSIYKLSPTRLEIGTNVPYAIYHQSTGKRRKLPRRPPVDIPKTVMGIKGEWIELFRKRIVEERRRIFGAMGT